MQRRRNAKPALRRKLTLTLSIETSIRLGVEAGRRGCTRSAAAELLLAEALKHIVVSIRKPGTPAPESETEAA
jgi:hypothetical protein